MKILTLSISEKYIDISEFENIGIKEGVSKGFSGYG